MGTSLPRQLLTVPPADRPTTFEACFAALTAEGADELADALLAMEPVPFRTTEGNADTELMSFLEANEMHRPLALLAERASPAKRAVLLACASISAAITLDLADLPYAYARSALFVDPTSALAAQALEDSLYGYRDDLFEDLLRWSVERPDVAAVALAAARRVAPSWPASARKELADLESLPASYRPPQDVS
jgi:hypothetical protein